MERTELWLAVLDELRSVIMKAHFLTWFQNTKVLSLNDGKMTVAVPTVYAQNWISSKYHQKVLEAAKKVDESITDVDYELKSALSLEGSGVDVKAVFKDVGEKKVRKVRNMPEVNMRKPGSKHKVGSQMLNTRYRLNNFIVGIDNRLPHAACNAVVNMPGGIYNPLYIYGSVGLGKTHLVQAVGNEILIRYPDMIVKYITAEKFVTEVVEAIGKRHMKQFKMQYRDVDCFLIDDVQFFARKDSSQQEFFHTFNALYEANKQIILTSDRPPSELDGLDDRLVSRFGMGMVVEVLPPDFETRLAILQQKCLEHRVLIDPEVLSFISNNISASVRMLEGVMKQVVAEMQLFERVPTIGSVAEIIKRMNKAQEIIGYEFVSRENRKVVKSLIDVVEVVAGYYNISVEDIIGKSRKKEFSQARQICMYLIKNELRQSYEKIGIGFSGRNHTTVMHACNKTADLLRKDVKILREVNALKKEMGL